MEHPSAAPTPQSRRIFCACSKFGALNNDLVMKCRAKIQMYTIKLLVFGKQRQKNWNSKQTIKVFTCFSAV